VLSGLSALPSSSLFMKGHKCFQLSGFLSYLPFVDVCGCFLGPFSLISSIAANTLVFNANLVGVPATKTKATPKTFIYLFFKFFSFIRMCIQCLGHFSFLPDL
jgi:hypothetical protein